MRGAGSLELIYVDKIGVGRGGGPGLGGIEVARTIEVYAAHGGELQRKIVLAAPHFAFNRNAALHDIREPDAGIDRHDTRRSHARRRDAERERLWKGGAGQRAR